ncbi:MAG: diaminopimelate decarboxylase [Gammaproteobacteria bacterium]|jgi:diaminopimelate decarboxylase
MSVFELIDGTLHVESVPALEIARAVGTPVYVYSRRHLETRYESMARAIRECGTGGRVCYAVKANSNLSVLTLFRQLGAGFDIVSGGELQRVLAAGGDPGSVVFSGVGKTTEELDLALKVGIGCFNVESEPELLRLKARAALLSRHANVAMRVNPDVDPGTHPYISTGLKENKFGVPAETAIGLYETARADEWLRPVGVACHIGSQIRSPEPMLQALDSLLAVVDTLAGRGIEIEHLDLGGGFGVSYEDPASNDDVDFDIDAYGAQLAGRLAGRSLAVTVEPGRYLVANGGVLLTRVEYLKPATMDAGRSFAVVDAAMNDLIRPALYSAHHHVEPASRPGPGAIAATWEVVGPVCESGDFLARGRSMTIAADDLLAIHSAGAYGMVQASNYNSRPRPAEVLVDGDAFRIIRHRETIEDLMRGERACCPGTAH